MAVNTLIRPAESAAGSPKRRQIVEAARRLFMADGYGPTSMDAISRAAGVSKATLYAHFTNKAELFAAIIGGECERFSHMLWDENVESGDLRSVLRQIADAALRFGSEDTPLSLYRIVVGESGRFPELGRVFYDNGPRRVLDRLAGYLKGVAARGLLEVADPRLAAEQFIGMVRGVHYLRRVLGAVQDAAAPDVEVIAQSAVELFLKAYAPSPK